MLGKTELQKLVQERSKIREAAFNQLAVKFGTLQESQRSAFFSSLTVAQRNLFFLEAMRQGCSALLYAYINHLSVVEERCVTPVNDRDGLILPNGLIVPINVELRHRDGIQRFLKHKGIWKPELEEFFLNAGGIVVLRNILMLNESVPHFKMKTKIQSGVNFIIATYKARNMNLKRIELSYKKSTYFFDAQTLERVPFSLSLATERKLYEFF